MQLPDNLKEKYAVVHFYQQLSLVIDQNDEPLFKNISTFTVQILALPISNTDVERIFSKTKLINTDIRKNLHTKSIAALTVISEAVKKLWIARGNLLVL